MSKNDGWREKKRREREMDLPSGQISAVVFPWATTDALKKEKMVG